jgi:hypothetical protein
VSTIFNIAPVYGTVGNNLTLRGFYYNPSITPTLASHKAWENTTGDVIFGSTSGNAGFGTSSINNKVTVSGNIDISNKLFVGLTTGTAQIHIKGGTTAAGTAQMKFNSGSTLTTPETGAWEFDGVSSFFTPVSTRLRNVLTNNTIPSNGMLPIGNGSDYTNATLSAGTGIVITNSSGSVTIATNGTINRAYTEKNSAYTATTNDNIINCTGGTFTVTLPTATGKTGTDFIIKNTGTGIITINTTSSQTIDGSTTQTLNTQYSSYNIVSTGLNWIII